MQAARVLASLSIVAAVLVGGERAARAQYNVPAQATGSAQDSLVIARGEPKPQPTVTPIGWELGGSLDFITSDPSLAGKKLQFTDVVLFRAHGLIAIGRRLELFGGLDLLPKQPSYTNERVWQGALLGARDRFTDALSAYARGAVGPVLGRAGWWVGGEAAAQYKRDLAERTLFWESALGGTYTRLLLDPPATGAFWQTELLAQTGIAVRDKRGIFATWLDFAFDFPLVARPGPGRPDPGSGLALDPQTRVGVFLGMLLGVSPTLDLFLELSVLDRGDLDNPQTTLPILSGGFDQKQIVFGFNRRFGERRRR